MWDEISRQGRYKLGPTASGLVDFFVQKTAVGQELPDNPAARAGSIVGQRMVPMTWADVYEAEKSLNLKQGIVAAIEAFMGASVNTYGQLTKYRNASEEDRAKMVKEAKAIKGGEGMPDVKSDSETPYKERLAAWQKKKAAAVAFLEAISQVAGSNTESRRMRPKRR